MWDRGLTGDAGDDEVYERLVTVAPEATTAAEAVAAANAALLGSSSRLRLLTTDDLALAPHQPNVPGLNDEPNWKLRLPLPVDQLL